MTISKRKTKKGTVYQARLWNQGASRCATFSKLHEAQRWLREEKNKIDLGYKNHQGILFKDYFLFFLDKHKPHYEYKTWVEYKGLVNKHIIPVCGYVSLADINSGHVDIIRENCSDLSNRQKNKIILKLKAVLEYATKGTFPQKRINFNPLREIKLLKEINHEMKFWDKFEARDFIEKTKDDEFWFLYFFAMNTGMRMGELLALTWRDIDFGTGLIFVGKSLKRSEEGLISGTTKTNNIRYIPMTEALFNECKKRKSNGLIFCKKDGKPIDINHVSHRMFKPLQIKVGMKTIIRFHDLRHTFASIYLMSGGSIFDLSKILGHTSIDTTQRYSHLTIGHLQEKIRGFAI